MMGTMKKVPMDRSDWKMDLCFCSMKLLNFLLIVLCILCTIHIILIKLVPPVYFLTSIISQSSLSFLLYSFQLDKISTETAAATVGLKAPDFPQSEIGV